VHGCHVTGIELTQPFVEVADLLSKRTGLSHRLRFVQGDEYFRQRTTLYRNLPCA
jgi:hypothetical protein